MSTSDQKDESAKGTPGLAITPPKPLCIEDNMAPKWKQWWRHFSWFALATDLNSKQSQIQAATFLSCIGAECIQVLDTFGLTAEQEADMKLLKEKFDKHFEPKSCLTYERYVFGKIQQSSGEQFDVFVTRVRVQAQKCAFDVLSDSMIKDRIISGTVHTKLVPQLLNDEIDLQKTVHIIRSHEMSVKQSKVMLEPALEVDAVQHKRFEPERIGGREDEFLCGYCGLKHKRRACPAYNKRCMKCGRKGHFAERCSFMAGSSSKDSTASSAKVPDQKVRNKRYVKTIECEEDDEDELSVEELFIGSVVDDDEEGEDVWYESVQIKGKKVVLKLDSGAACNVLPYDVFCGLNEQLQQSKTKKLVSYSNHKLSVKGEALLPVIVRGREESAVFKIVEGEVSPILGRKTSVRFKLIARMDHISMDESLFNGLGCVKGFEYDIDLVDNPVFQYNAPRKIPHSLRDAVKLELDAMEKMGVIEPISEPTPVLNALVIVRQKGKLRICIDPSQVNKNLLRRTHPLSTIEEISARICGSHWFTTLDMKKGFWQIRVSKRTEQYLAFGTPWGRYVCKRLPFGLAAAPEVMQKYVCTLLVGLEGVESSMDDILIHAASKEQLQKRTAEVLGRFQAAGLKLNRDKCVFDQQSVKFLGHVVSCDGLKADPEKLDAIRRLKRPETRVQLQRVLGMVTYLAKFIPNLSSITEPLRKLLVKGTEWVWHVEQEQSFQEIKQLMVSPPVLAYYDVNAEVTLSVDASSKAFGAVLLQNNKPIAYASKSLSKAQENYPQIEKEAAAMRYACNKFHVYVYGKTLTIETDHKPLESIYKKSLDRAPPRLKRILLDVMQYNPYVVYKKGSDIPLPDILSRDVENKEEDDPTDELEVHIVLQMSKAVKAEFVEETQKDTELNQLSRTILDGWPHEKLLVPNNIRKYWTFRDELSYYEGLVFRAHQIVVPGSLRPLMLKYVHAGHTGVQGCIRRAKQMLFWVGMSSDITNTVESCTTCERYQQSNQKHEVMTHEIPTLPFEIVGSDLFHFQGDEYLLIADSYSGFFDFAKLRELTTKSVVSQLKSWFATHGVPRKLITDNGPQYASIEFAQFAKKWCFDHITSSPHYPKSNGLSERFVQTAKSLLKRCDNDGSDIQLALLHYRNTPRDGELQSSNQRLTGRLLRTNIPTTDHVLKPRIVEGVAENLKQRRQRQKQYADKGATKPAEYEEGDPVTVQNIKSRLWEKGRVEKKLDAPRSYIVHLSNGSTVRRNVRDLKPARSPTAIEEPEPIYIYQQQGEPRAENAQAAEPEDEHPPMLERELRNMITRSGRVVRSTRDDNFVYY